MEKYDLVIIGGGTAGCSAAYNSGKLGIKTLLLENTACLGGSITNGLVLPVMNSGENQINTDFYKALIAELKKIGGQITYQKNDGWFNPELVKIVLDKMMFDSGVKVLFNANINDFSINNEQISLKIGSSCALNCPSVSSENNEMLLVNIYSRYIIDATGDANFCKKIGCEFIDDNSDFQPMSLRFIMGGIDLDKFSKWLLEVDSDRNVTTVENIDGEVHLSTAYTWDTNKNWALSPIFDKAVNEGVLKDTDRNYFQVFSIAGMPNSLAFNCPRIVENLNPNDIYDTSKALVEARGTILRLSKFCKKYLKGFENAYISNIANSLGVRVSNRIKGKYIYTIDDLKSGKTFEHPVLISNYPVDVHSKDKNSSTLDMTSEYQLPIEALMPIGFDNIFVAGRCLSADYLAQGALRVQASCFSMGEALAKHIKMLLD